jgi:hypothetical protein
MIVMANSCLEVTARPEKSVEFGYPAGPDLVESLEDIESSEERVLGHLFQKL